jgi:tetratricopeptide (TPR) repeat protein
MERLQTGQMAVARRLAAASSETLVPLVTLHEEAYLRHLSAGRLQLAVRSRRFAVELIELYVAQSRRPDAGRLGSELLTSLGGHLQQSTMDNAATALYRRALALDGSNATAQLGLASLLERQGKYADALPNLEPLIRQGDQAPPMLRREAALRLGVNLFRLGRVTEGRAVLEDLVGEPTDDWIASLAYQELAREAVDHGEVGRAFELLEQAAERLPEDASLAVQLAYVTDRAGTHQGADRLRRSLERTVSRPGPSPRALYASASGAALTELRSGNADEARRRLESLGDAVGRWEDGR